MGNSDHGLSLANTKRTRTVLIRIYGRKSEVIIDRLGELSNLKILEKRGLVEPLLGRFRNGLVYGYVEGRALKREEVSILSASIAREMRKWHDIPLYKQQSSSDLLVTSSISTTSHPRQPMVFDLIRKWMDGLPRGFPDSPVKQAQYEIFDLDYLEECARWLEGNLAGASPLVFCHNDLLASNIVLLPNPDKGTPSHVLF